MITSREFQRNPFSILAKRNKYIWHLARMVDGTKTGRDRQGNNIMPPSQHRME